MMVLFILLVLLIWTDISISSNAQNISDFSLIKTPRTLIGSLPTIVNLAVVGRNLTIVANTTSTAGIARVRFRFDNKIIRNEGTAPYSLSSSGSTLTPFMNLTILGNHVIVAEAFFANGTIISRRSQNFTVIDRTTSTPSKSPSQEPSEIRTMQPSEVPTTDPTNQPSLHPSSEQTHYPSHAPSEIPTSDPSIDKTYDPSDQPSELLSHPSYQPSDIPVMHPSTKPSSTPSTKPSNTPSTKPSNTPSTKPSNSPVPSLSVQIKGELRKWHKVTIAFDGPFADESDPLINPFMDYRLDVLFTHAASNKQYNVPGYFAADGNAAETSATTGNQWHCHFAPDEVGTWAYRASFVSGINIAVSTLPGTPLPFDGKSGSFIISNTDKTGRDHRGKGRLTYVGKHHLQFAETGEWFLKAGSDSPENFLAYSDFDNTPNNGNRRKTWAPHEQHYVNGTDPSWQNGKGRGIIGAVNYLSNQGMNAFSFLTMNINGDDRNVYPYVTDTDFSRMDVSKLAQWEIVFEHADRMGMFLHFKTQEQENDQLLDGGNLGNKRKMYYREMIARFGHHLALNWNLGEETTNTVAQINTFTSFFKQMDPYQHPFVMHTAKDSLFYNNFLGNPNFSGPSLQLTPSRVFEFSLRWVRESAIARHKWIVTIDEQGTARDGVKPDSVDPNHNTIRQQVLWGNIMAGGAGVEYYFGYNYTNSDITCQDYSSRHIMWVQSRYALELFYNNNIPFWEMSYDTQNRVNNATDWILINPNSTLLLLYRRTTRTSSNIINMRNISGTYSVLWYNPRTGGNLRNGSTISILATGSNTNIPYGSSPNSTDTLDWVVLFRKN